MNFLPTFLMLLLLSFSCKTIQPIPISTEKKPHIIFILADDLGWQDVGFMGANGLKPQT